MWVKSFSVPHLSPLLKMQRASSDLNLFSVIVQYLVKERRFYDGPFLGFNNVFSVMVHFLGSGTNVDLYEIWTDITYDKDYVSATCLTESMLCDFKSQLMRLWYLSHRRPVKAQASLRIRAVSPEPLLFAQMKYGSRRRVQPKSRHLAQLCMRNWRMNLRRTKSAIISWAGS